MSDFEWFSGRSVDERAARYWRRRVIWVLLTGLIILALVWPFELVAVPAFKADGVNGKPAAIRLYDDPCTNLKVKAHLERHIKPEFIAKFRRASLLWDGKLWESCWYEHDGMVFSLDEEGSQFQPVPRSLFQEDTI